LTLLASNQALPSPTKKAGPRLTLPEVVDRENGLLTFPELPLARQAQEFKEMVRKFL
jgi:hypothetical protein